jgi:hypothetical protein
MFTDLKIDLKIHVSSPCKMAFSKRMTLIFLQEIMAVDSQDPEIIASLDRDVPRRRRHQ